MAQANTLLMGCMPCGVNALVDDLALTRGEAAVAALREAAAGHRFGEVVETLARAAREGAGGLTELQAERVRRLAGPDPFGAPAP